jgi:hypothetical protein
MLQLMTFKVKTVTIFQCIFQSLGSVLLWSLCTCPEMTLYHGACLSEVWTAYATRVSRCPRPVRAALAERGYGKPTATTRSAWDRQEEEPISFTETPLRTTSWPPTHGKTRVRLCLYSSAHLKLNLVVLKISFIKGYIYIENKCNLIRGTIIVNINLVILEISVLLNLIKLIHVCLYHEILFWNLLCWKTQ